MPRGKTAVITDSAAARQRRFAFAERASVVAACDMDDDGAAAPSAGHRSRGPDEQPPG